MSAASTRQVEERVPREIEHRARAQRHSRPGHVQRVVGRDLQLKLHMHVAGYAIVFGAKGVAQGERIGLHLIHRKHLEAAATRPAVVVVWAAVGGQLQV